MTPNATLLAYSIPTDVKDLKDMAALVSMMWKEREAALHGGSKRSESPASIASSEVSVGSLETLTIESGSNNFLARAIQPQLLFVLVGGVPPGRQKELKVTSEVNGDLRYPSSEPSEDSKSQPGSLSRGSPSRRSTSNFSTLSQREKDMKLGLLHIQRKKLDTMVRFIKGEFNAMGFVMPSDQ